MEDTLLLLVLLSVEAVVVDPEMLDIHIPILFHLTITVVLLETQQKVLLLQIMLDQVVEVDKEIVVP
tara:strand:+ start:128 stop:328 length:201 start_codon:yes stop_codon:yes gene_type:complete